MLMFGFALVAGMLLTSARKHLFNRWLLIGGAIALLIFLPNLVWNVQHHFPFLEEQQNIHRSGRDVLLSPFLFFAEEALAMLPLTLPIWIAGVWWLFRGPYRALAWAWTIAAAPDTPAATRVALTVRAKALATAAGELFDRGWAEFVQVRHQVALASLGQFSPPQPSPSPTPSPTATASPSGSPSPSPSG
jgi:hypothetical protein